MNKLSLQMYTLREYTKTWEDFNNTIGRLSEIGFKTLQYDVPAAYDAKEVKRVFDEYGVVNDSVFCPVMDIEDNTKKIISECEVFNTKYVRTSAIVSGLAKSASGYKCFAHYLNEACEELKKHDIKLLYHFHAFEFCRFGDNTGIDIILNETDPEVIQILPDTHWIHKGGMNVVKFLDRYKDRFDYIHLKDLGIAPRGDTWESGTVVFAPVGEGNLDWTEIIEFCKNNNIKSYAIEQDNCYGRDEFDCVISSYNYMKKFGLEN